MESIHEFLLIFLICFLLLPSNAQGDVSELSILQDFISQSKASSNGSWGLSDWEASSSNYCNWSGITCSASGSIVNMDLQSRGLISPLSTVICNLPNLAELSLYNNTFSESFPVGLFNCSKNLQVLNLSTNAFSGSLPTSGWHNFSGLVKLDLADNAFTGQFPSQIGDELLSLEYLSIWSNGFTGSIPSELGNLTNLRNLTIAWNNYTYGALPEELKHLTKLEWFYAGGARLTGSLPTWLSGLQSLKHLDLSYNLLSGEIPSDVFSWPNIEVIELFFNSFSGSIPPSIGNLANLTELDLSCNQLEGSIPPELGKLSKLNLLNLWNNSLIGEIPWELANLTSLQTFQVFNNSLTGTIPQNFGKGGNMLIFDVSGNHLHGSIPPYVCDGNSLKKLILFNNNISGNIPDAYGSCTTLQRVRLFGNQLSGTVPSGLWGLPNMNVLHLHKNNLSGVISPEIGKAVNLLGLLIHDNSFTGSLPESIGQLSVLLTLDISYNELSGSIPATLAGCRSMQMLSVQYNDFTGPVPDVFANLTSLGSIDLSNNQLTGSIPSSLGQLSNIDSLYLGHNRFSGSIPASLGNLQYSLSDFDVSYNDLSGSLPFRLGGAFTIKSFEGNNLLCLSENCRAKMGSLRAAWIAGIVLFVITILMVGACYFCQRRKAYHKMRQESSVGYDKWTFIAFERVTFNEYNLLSCLDEDNIIGRGGSGQVYQCQLDDGQSLAVKRLWVSTSKGVESQHDYGFKAEIDTIGKVRHSNLVRLICCCTNNRDTSLLVYEYMPNGSLGDLLHGKKSDVLDWNTRFKIAIGAAKGLAYLHHDCLPPIVHRDVKPNNILLDAEYGAHIADFGLAKVLNNYSEKGFSISGMAGSIGYMAPEMGYASKVTEKSDVYSFGVVLLELLTGKKAFSEAEFGPGMDLVRWVTGKLHSKEEVTGTVLFTKQMTKDEQHEMLVVLRLALRCTSAMATQRPAMTEVVEILAEAWRQGGRPELSRGNSFLTRYPSSASIKPKKLQYCSSTSSTSSSRSLLSIKRNSAEEPPSPGAIFELEYCKAQLSGR